MRENFHKSIKWKLSLVIFVLLITTAFSSAIGNTPCMDEGKTDFFIPVSYDTSYRICIQTSNVEMLALDLESNGFDVLWNTVTSNSMELIVTPRELTQLEEQGYNPVTLENGRPFRDIQVERVSGSLAPPPGYPDLSQIYAEMTAAETAYPSICKMVDLTTTYGISPTYENRNLYAIKISDNVSEDEDEPTFLMVSCHHAREIVTPVIALYAIEQLTTEYGSDPQITTLIDEYEIWISPVWNPDGYNHVFNVDNMWRKNKRPPDGVDLNRNYPFGWNGACSGSTDPYSETYKGPYCASEPETQTMITFSNDRHFTKVVDYHSSGREVLWGYDSYCYSHPFDSFLQSEAVELSTASNYGGSIRGPSAMGEHYEWQLWTNGSYANLIETHTQFQPSYASAQTEAALVWSGVLWMLERPISLNGHVTDSISGQPLEATIELIGVTFPNGEEFKSESSFGRYHLFLPAGSYTVNFSVPDYTNQSHQVTITPNGAEILDILLVPDNNPPEPPDIDGPTKGDVGKEYEFTIMTMDPFNEDVYYWIEWGDGTMEEWIGPYASGENVFASHTWTENGTYSIRVKAKNALNAEGAWSETFNITIFSPELDAGYITGGLFKVNAVIKNIGDAEATDIDWSITLEGGVILLGEETTGTIPSIPEGGEVIVSSSLILGFGNTIVKVSMEEQYGSSDVREQDATILLFFIKVN
jgi:hypothetical protein